MDKPKQAESEDRSSAFESRSGRYVRFVPAMCLAAFYFLIGLQWSLTVARHIGSLIDGGTPARDILIVIEGVSTGLFFFLVGGLMFVRKEPIRRERNVVAWMLPVVAVLTMGLVGGGTPKDIPLPLSLVATVIIVGGTGFTVYALRHLGRHFGVVSDVRGLVTTGPYRFVRHPLYAGETITSAGLLIVVFSPSTAAAFAIGLAAQLARIRLEERALTTVFPSYRDYAARTPMLLPRWRPDTSKANPAAVSIGD